MGKVIAAITVMIAVVFSTATAHPRLHHAVSQVAVAPQYDTTHVYVTPQDFDRCVASLIATFGGHATEAGAFTVTPTASLTRSQLVLTPVGTFSIFGFQTPIPYPFGAERTGYLVSDMDRAVQAAKVAGADVVVSPYPDPIGRDAIIQWPGGVEMQLYWHTTQPAYEALQTVPENRVYLSAQAARKFIREFLDFAHGRVVSDNPKAPGAAIGRPDETVHRVRILSGFGKLTVFVTDGHLPYPYGREVTGIQVADLKETLTKAEAAGASVLVAPYREGDRQAAMVRFPGGYIAEVHTAEFP